MGWNLGFAFITLEIAKGMNYNEINHIYFVIVQNASPLPQKKINNQKWIFIIL